MRISFPQLLPFLPSCSFKLSPSTRIFLFVCASIFSFSCQYLSINSAWCWQTSTNRFLQFLAASELTIKLLMSPQSKSNPSRALDGVHGVHVVPHSPFALEEITKPGDFHQSPRERSYIEANQRLLMQRVWQQRPACLRPIRCCLNDDESLGETIANVLTSLPFIALGMQAPRKNLNCKLYANSLIGVGIASGLYHSSRGKLRKYLRWADYTMIATTTVCLSRALRNENPKLLMAASAFFLPIQPLMVSAVHTGMMEVAFAKRAFDDPDLRLVHNVHKMSSLLGCALFIADDVFPRTPFIHAAWHLTAAVGVGTCNKLLE